MPRYTIDLDDHQVDELRTLLPAGALRKKPARRRRETEDYTAAARRMLRGLAVRAEGDVDMLPALAELRDLVDEVIYDHVVRARSIEVSWSEIGQRLGLSKQGAQQWFARRDGSKQPTSAQRQQRVDGERELPYEA